MSIKKQYLKSKPLCKVTFTHPKEAVGSARTVHIAGDFNNWDTHTTPMKKKRNGAFSTAVSLETGREYQFRYVIDETNWENDWEADRYVASGVAGTENSVVVV